MLLTHVLVTVVLGSGLALAQQVDPDPSPSAAGAQQVDPDSSPSAAGAQQVPSLPAPGSDQAADTTSPVPPSTSAEPVGSTPSPDATDPAAALYGDATRYRVRGRYANARELFNEILVYHPDSPYAELARNALKELEGQPNFSPELIPRMTRQTFVLTLLGTESYRASRSALSYVLLGEWLPILEWARPIPPAVGGMLASAVLMGQEAGVPLYLPGSGAYTGQVVLGATTSLFSLPFIKDFTDDELFAWKLAVHVASTVGSAAGAAIATNLNLKGQLGQLPGNVQLVMLPSPIGDEKAPGLMLVGSF